MAKAERIAVVCPRLAKGATVGGAETLLRELAVHAAENGIGMHEMRPPSRVRPDVEQVDKIINWLEGWEARRKRALHITGIRRQPFSRVTTLRKSQVNSA